MFAAGERWVIEGNFGQVRDLVWSRADNVVWLDLPRGDVAHHPPQDRALGGVLGRPLGAVLSAAPDFCSPLSRSQCCQPSCRSGGCHGGGGRRCRRRRTCLPPRGGAGTSAVPHSAVAGAVVSLRIAMVAVVAEPWTTRLRRYRRMSRREAAKVLPLLRRAAVRPAATQRGAVAGRRRRPAQPHTALRHIVVAIRSTRSSTTISSPPSARTSPRIEPVVMWWRRRWSLCRSVAARAASQPLCPWQTRDGGSIGRNVGRVVLSPTLRARPWAHRAVRGGAVIALRVPGRRRRPTTPALDRRCTSRCPA